METTPTQTTPRSNPEISPSNKKFHKFLIFSPVLLLFTFILLVYVTYIVVYIIPLMNSKNNLNTTFPFIATTSISSAYAKGITLLVFVSFCFLMLFISMIRVAVMDPGYFPDPSQLEGKLLAKQINKGFIRDFTKEKEWSDYVRKFGEVLEKGPLTFPEGHEIKRTVVFKPFQKNLIELLEEPQFRVKEILTFRTDELFKSEENQLQEENQAINYNDLFENFKATDLFAIPLCSQCLRWKIERSHHCRQCGKCVLKMDHHCPWLANCIGFRNYKYFSLVAFYGLVSSLIVASTFWEAVYSYYNSTHFVFACYIIYSYVCNLGLLCFVVWLFFYNTPLLFKNQTLIENSDLEKFPVSARVYNPYNVGKYMNFTSVFGNNPLLWLLPFSANYEGEGLVFAKNKLE